MPNLRRFRATIVATLTVCFLAASAQAAQACTATWYGPGGNSSAATTGSWETASNWSADAVPGSTDDVCITLPGTYTVTLAPETGVAGGDGVNSLTLGAASGSQTLDISGQGFSYRGDQYNQETLTVAGATTIAATGTLVLDATNQTASGTTVGADANAGGGSAALAGNVVNDGHIVAQSEDPSWGAILQGSLTNEAAGNVSVNSGTLLENQAWTSTNDGTITVASGAGFNLAPGLGFTADFINDGSVANNGSIAENPDRGAATWTQSGGSVSGNPVALQGGTTLADSAGTGAFVADYQAATITGTIPAGQTVTVQGAPFNDGGENYNSTSLSLNGATLVNDGTLALDAPGSGTSSGGSAYLTDGTVQNHGTITADTQDPSWAIHLQAGLANAHGGTVSISGGAFDQDSGTATTNDGLVTLAPGVNYLLDQGASFSNESDGTLSPEIASSSSAGTFQLASPCCAGSGAFTAGGTLAPVLTGGFAPAADQEFPLVAISGNFSGKFATVGNGFSGDYSHDASSPAYFGAIYGGAAAAAAATAHLISASGADGKLTLKLSCPAGGAACAPVKVTAKVTEHLKRGKITSLAAMRKKKGGSTTKHVVIAAGSAKLAAGTTRTLTLSLNSSGRALLKRFGKLTVSVSVTSGGKTIDTVTVHVEKKKTKKKKHRS
jgi:hypothetical protein